MLVMLDEKVTATNEKRCNYLVYVASATRIYVGVGVLFQSQY